MSPATSVTYDRLRWWIVGAALVAATVSAVSLAVDVDATGPAARDTAAATVSADR